jgi:hypothetical protein
MRNSTRVTPILSLAVTYTFVVRTAVDPLLGEVIRTVGAMVSAAFCTVTLFVAELPTFSAAS